MSAPHTGETDADRFDPLYCTRCHRRAARCYLSQGLCPACRHAAEQQAAAAAATLSPSQPGQTVQKASTADTIAGMLVILAIIMGLYAIGRAMPPTWDFAAARAARNAVQGALLAPSTARFSDERMILNEDETTATVWGFVEASNGFGVPIRSKWAVDVEKRNGQWVAGEPHIETPF